MRDVMDVADPGTWLALDAAVREAGWRHRTSLPAREEVEGPAAGGSRQRAEAFRRRADALTEGRLAVALCHPDGRVREAALGRVVEHLRPLGQSGRAATRTGLLPLVVIRGADWAEPVCERARVLLRDALPQLGAEETAVLARLLVRVGRRERGGFGVELLSDTLRRGPSERFVPLFTDRDRAVRRLAYGVALEQQVLSPAQWARAAAGDDDAVVQDVCAEAALAGLAEADADGADGDGVDEVLRPLLSARNPRARSAGVTALRRAGRPEAARPFLTDRSALVRACARYVLRQGGTDPLPLYQAWCADPADEALPPGAPIGLAECGTRADAALLGPLLRHPVPTVRARAVAGLRTLGHVDVERLRPLIDDAPAVAREATLALAGSARPLPEDWLTPRLAPEWPRHTRLAAFRLLVGQGGMVRLRASVRLLDDPDPKLRGWAERSLQG
ncbi:hypothetical protein [Streptomyces sp. NPDC047928]|uniref:hypothetical protein n=1 Tax=unclassified Streptomyces TaxID=2593676 RepID=UPI00371422F9